MSRLSLPVAMTVEYRGQEAPTSFTRRETGELVEIPLKLKCERETLDGDAVPVELPLRDELECKLDPATLKKGELLHVEGEVVLNETRAGTFGRFLPHRVSRVAANGKVETPAAS